MREFRGIGEWVETSWPKLRIGVTSEGLSCSLGSTYWQLVLLAFAGCWQGQFWWKVFDIWAVKTKLRVMWIHPGKWVFGVYSNKELVRGSGQEVEVWMAKKRTAV